MSSNWGQVFEQALEYLACPDDLGTLKPYLDFSSTGPNGRLICEKCGFNSKSCF